MAKLTNSLLGGFTGSIGEITGYYRNGVHYIRRKVARDTNRVPTPAQQVQHAKFKLVNAFLNTMSELIRFSFIPRKRIAGRNYAMSFTYKNGIEGSYPELRLDFSKLLVASGRRMPAQNASAALSQEGLIDFQWEVQMPDPVYGEDKALMVVHCPALRKTIFLKSGMPRKAAKASIDARAFSGQEVHTWLAFYSEGKWNISDSVYTGRIALS